MYHDLDVVSSRATDMCEERVPSPHDIRVHVASLDPVADAMVIVALVGIVTEAVCG